MNTPETDALRKSIDSGADAEAQMTSFARRLELERDDALSQIVQAECRAERFCQERDEAREERDEARKEIDRYREKNDLLPISWDV